MFKHIGYALTTLVLLASLSQSLKSQTMVWETNFGGVLNEMGNSCQVLPDSSIMILGTTYSYGSGLSDIYLLKTDEFGNLLWSRQYGSDSTDFGYDLQATSDGGFIIVGLTTKNKISKDIYLIKTDSSGIVEWEKSFGGAGGESGFAARQTADSGYVLIGSTGSYGVGYSSIYVVRTDKNGDSLWTKTYGGNRADFGYSVEVTNDGGFIFVGATASYGNGESDAYLVKTDPSGNFEWDYTYGGANDDRGYSVKELASGNFVLTGKTESYSSNIEAYLIMTNPIGAPMWISNFGGSQSDEAQCVTFDNSEDIIVVGKSYSYSSGGSDVYLFKVKGDQSTDINELILTNYIPDGYELKQNYPNPFNMQTSIEYSIPTRSDVTLTIYNVLGQVVSYWDASSLPAGTYRYEWDGTNEQGSDIASGVYLYRLQTGAIVQTKKMLLLK